MSFTDNMMPDSAYEEADTSFFILCSSSFQVKVLVWNGMPNSAFCRSFEGFLLAGAWGSQTNSQSGT